MRNSLFGHGPYCDNACRGRNIAAAAVNNKDLRVVNITIFPQETTCAEHTLPFPSLQETRYYCPMDPFLKMDIFFVVAALVVIALGVILLLIGLRLWRILGHVEKIMEIAEEETELIKEDIADLRSDIRRRGFSMFSLGRFVRKVTSNFTKRSKKDYK